MKKLWIWCTLSCWMLQLAAVAYGIEQPNIMVVLVDDMGFSDLGCYGGEIETPNLDALANTGLRFTQFHNSGRCWPTRAAILTGYYAQQVRRDKLAGKGGGAGGKRPAWAQLLPKMLAPLGYRSYHSGKWHVDDMPCRAGFDHSYFLGDQARFFSPKRVFIDDVQQPAISRDSNYYGTTAIAEHAIEHLQDHALNHSDQPFFYYLAFTAPHFPLQALPEDFAKYEDHYHDGWDVQRAKRWDRIRQMGLIESGLSEVERDVGPPYEYPEQIKQFGPGETSRPIAWDSLTDEQQKFQAMKMSLHAAMIDRIDREFGRIVEQLRKMNALDNTLIFFLSDNGASAEIMIRDDGHDPDAEPGSADTHYCLGPGWSTVCNTPFRKHKTWVHEGGIATPLIVHWPAVIKSGGDLRHTPGHVIDLAPTILQVAGGNFSKVHPDQPDLPGKSLLPSFGSDNQIERDYLWWSHDNHWAIRVGRWKLVKTRQSAWELFDIERDRAETTDLASEMPTKVNELDSLWHTKEQEFIRDLELTDVLPKPEEKIPLGASNIRPFFELKCRSLPSAN